MQSQWESSIAFIGGGPRTTGILERLAKNSDSSTAALTVHIVEPFEPGSGRIWRREQSPLLKLNSLAADVTMFTDSSVQMAGPAAPGPSLIEWAVGIRQGSITDVPVWETAVQRELESLEPDSFPTRILQARYLQWCYARAVRALPPQIEVRIHRCLAESIEILDDGKHRVRLSAGFEPLIVDAVVLATGHSEPQRATGNAWSTERLRGTPRELVSTTFLHRRH